MKILKNIALATLFTTAFAGNLMSMDDYDEPVEIGEITRQHIQGRQLIELLDKNKAILSLDSVSKDQTAKTIYDVLYARIAEGDAFEEQALQLAAYKEQFEKSSAELREANKLLQLTSLNPDQQAIVDIFSAEKTVGIIKRKLPELKKTDIGTATGVATFMEVVYAKLSLLATLEAQKRSHDAEFEEFLTDSGISCEMPGYVKGDAVANVHALYELLPQTFTDMAELERKLKAATQRISELEEAAKLSSNF